MPKNKFTLTQSNEKLEAIFDDKGNVIPAEDNMAIKALLVKIDNLYSGQYQPRKSFNETTLLELANSIREQGIIQPIIVRKVNEKHYEIIAGERRWRAARMAQLHEVPVIIRNYGDEDASAAALIENIQRQNLNPLEEAKAYERLIEKFNMTHQQICKKVGRSRPAVTNILRLLTLSDPVQKLLNDGVIDMGHARALLSIDDNQQLDLVKKIANQNLSVRETEKLVHKIKKPKKTETQILPKYYKDWLEAWRQRIFLFKHHVKLVITPSKKIKLTIECGSTEEAEKLLERLEGS